MPFGVASQLTPLRLRVHNLRMHVVRMLLVLIYLAIFGAIAIGSARQGKWMSAAASVAGCFAGLQAWRKYSGSIFGTSPPEEWERRQ